jgi:hypothetical protein
MLIMFYVLGFGVTVLSSIFLMSILEIDYHITAMLWVTLMPTLLGLFLFTLIFSMFLKKRNFYMKIFLPNLIWLIFFGLTFLINLKNGIKFNLLDLTFILPHVLSIMILLLTYKIVVKIQSRQA